jgi:hypothetical protein
MTTPSTVMEHRDRSLDVPARETQAPTNGKRRAAPKAAPAYAVGLDVGYAYVKWLAQDGTRQMLPTAVAPMDLDTGQRGALRASDHLVQIDGTAYLVGQGAIWSGRRLTDHLRWDTWWHSIPYRAVLAALAERVPPGAIVVTGVPLSIPLAPAISEPIERILKQTLKARQVVVTQQGLAAAVALNLLDEAAQLALIDVGGRTTEFVTIRHGQVHTARSAGLRAGVCELYETVAAKYREQWHWDVDSYAIEQAVRGALPLARMGHDPAAAQRDLHEQVRLAAKPLADRLLAKCRDLWHDGLWLDRVILCGGGADLVAETLRLWRSDLVLADDRQWLNARGYLRLAAELLDAREPAPGAAEGTGDDPAGKESGAR